MGGVVWHGMSTSDLYPPFTLNTLRTVLITSLDDQGTLGYEGK